MKKVVQLNKCLKKLKITNSDTLIVHSSFKTLSTDGFKPKKFCEYLSNYLNKGTLIFPTLSWKKVKKTKFFDYKKTQSDVGILSETFRRNHKLRRSFHPTHSLVSSGKKSDSINNAKNYLFSSPCGKGSPWEKLLFLNSKILMIDTFIDTCTLVHYFEEQFNKEFFLEKKYTKYICKNNNNKKIIYKVRNHKEIKRNFLKIFFLLQQKKKVNQYFLNKTSFICFSAKDLQKVAISEFEKNDKATLQK